jgi:hypothetical protein
MKSKNPQAFWWRWMGVSALHAIAYIGVWASSVWFFMSWYGTALYNFGFGIFLAALHYWAMPLTMRPNAKRWFPISVFSYALAVIAHTLVVQSSSPNVNSLGLWLSLFLLPALAQAWALREHFKKTWIFALAAFLPVYLLFVQFPFPVSYFFYGIFIYLLRALIMGGSLVLLQKYQRKKADSFDATSHERLELREEEDANQAAENIAYTQQKQS